MSVSTKRDVAAEIRRLARERILVLDGAWGTMIHGAGLAPEDYRGERFRHALARRRRRPGRAQPHAARTSSRSIHERYLAAGADITTTNTFTATSIGQADYGLEDAVYEMNVAGARIAREAAGDRFVAGSVGPLNVTLSLSPRVDDPSLPHAHLRRGEGGLRRADRAALVEGGVDLLLLETIFDTLNAKAAIVAARETAPGHAALDLGHDRRPLGPHALGADDRGVLDLGRARRPARSSASTARSARRRCGRTWPSSRTSRRASSACHPNAGLPNAFGGYDETPEVTSTLLGEFAAPGFLNIAGSCCGSTPEHTRAIAAAVAGPRAARARRAAARGRAGAASSRSRSARTRASC